MSLIITVVLASVFAIAVNIFAIQHRIDDILRKCAYEPSLNSRVLGYVRLIHPTIYLFGNSYPLEFINMMLVLSLGLPKYTGFEYGGGNSKYNGNTAQRSVVRHVKCGMFSLSIAISLYCNDVDAHVAYIKKQVAEQMYVYVGDISLGMLTNCYRNDNPYREWVFPNKNSTGILIGYHDDRLVYLRDE